MHIPLLQMAWMDVKASEMFPTRIAKFDEHYTPLSRRIVSVEACHLSVGSCSPWQIKRAELWNNKIEYKSISFDLYKPVRKFVPNKFIYFLTGLCKFILHKLFSYTVCNLMAPRYDILFRQAVRLHISISNSSGSHWSGCVRLLGCYMFYVFSW